MCVHFYAVHSVEGFSEIDNKAIIVFCMYTDYNDNNYYDIKNYAGIKKSKFEKITFSDLSIFHQ